MTPRLASAHLASSIHRRVTCALYDQELNQVSIYKLVDTVRYGAGQIMRVWQGVQFLMAGWALLFVVNLMETTLPFGSITTVLD